MANINFGGNNDNDRNNSSRSRHNRNRHDNEQVLLSGGEQKNGFGWSVSTRDNGSLFSIGGIIGLFSAIKQLKAGKPEETAPDQNAAEEVAVSESAPLPTAPLAPPLQQGNIPPIAPPPVFRAPPSL